MQSFAQCLHAPAQVGIPVELKLRRHASLNLTRFIVVLGIEYFVEIFISYTGLPDIETQRPRSSDSASTANSLPCRISEQQNKSEREGLRMSAHSRSVGRSTKTLQGCAVS